VEEDAAATTETFQRDGVHEPHHAHEDCVGEAAERVLGAVVVRGCDEGYILPVSLTMLWGLLWGSVQYWSSAGAITRFPIS